MKVLVTGAAGFIGSHTVKYLVNLGHDVIGVDRRLDWSRVSSMPSAMFSRYREDVQNTKAMTKLCQEVCCVIHLAATASVPECEKHPIEAFDNNVGGTISMLLAAKAAGVGRFVFASSAAVYGKNEGQTYEALAPDPISVYGASKYAAEAVVASYDNMGLNTVILRYFNVYGPGQNPESPYSGVISKFLLGALQGEVTVHGTGEQSRDFVYCTDVARANVLASNCLTYLAPQGVYNIGTGKATSLIELIDTLKSMGLEFKVKSEPERTGDIKKSWASIKEASLLAYKPVHHLKDGLETTLKWVKEYGLA